MQITDNIPFVIGSLLSKFKELENPETISRAAALAVMPELRERIHEEGKKSDNSQIGEYSILYLKLRQRKYNRTADKKVIGSLTRQLENSYILGPTTKGYGISVATPLSQDKIQWLTEKYGIIWQLTESEKNIAYLAAVETANKILE
jgi:hypothetical protein